jgi:GTP-binding protein Era
MTEQEKEIPTRCGYVSIIGLPNAGKSTLVNTLVGTKVSIVSRKVQTTRTRILGLCIEGASQIVLIDTPGIFAPQKILEKAMVQAALGSVDDADIIVHLVDATGKNPLHSAKIIIERLPKNKPCVLALNKTDAIQKDKLLALAASFNEAFPYEKTFMISGLKGKGMEQMMQYFTENIPEGPWLFPEDQATDMPMRMLAAEITREKIFIQLHDELPYAAMVETEKWEDRDDGSILIEQVIYVTRDTQKAIVLGKGGAQIKSIGQYARLELEEMMGTRVHLKLFVKVEKDWSEKSETYRMMGLDFPD